MKIALSKTDDHLTLAAARVLANDVTFDGEFNPHNVGLFVISNEFGPVAAVWANNVQHALDVAVDNDLMQSFACEGPTHFDDEDQEHYDEDGVVVTHLGNAGEPFYLDDCSVRRIEEEHFPMGLLLAFAEARGAGADTLDDVKAAGLARVRE